MAATCVARASNLRPLLATDEVENQIALDRKVNPLYESKLLKPIQDWKVGVAERTGFNWSLDYSALFMGVSGSPGEDSASGGMVRFFGFWDLVNRGGPNKGSLNWKIENRHRYSDIPPSALGFASGYAGIFEPPFSNEGWRLTNLYWRQGLADGRLVLVGGWVDATDYLDIYGLVSPWLHFSNFAFGTGSATIPAPNQGLGLAAGLWASDKVYVLGGFADSLAKRRIVPYEELEGMPTSAVPGHAGRLVLGEVGILTVQDGYSTAKVTRSWTPFFVGDRVELK